jgi:hypothetical protein
LNIFPKKNKKIRISFFIFLRPTPFESTSMAPIINYRSNRVPFPEGVGAAEAVLAAAAARRGIL